MRGAVDNAAVAHPLGQALPAVFQEDDPAIHGPGRNGFLQRLTSGLDQVLAPVFSTLDNLAAYFDPTVAPEDFLAWLAEWVGLPLDQNWPVPRQRQLVATAVDLHGSRGTLRGLRDHVALFTGCEVEVSDTTDGVAPGTTEKGGPAARVPSIRVVVTVPAGGAVDRERLERVVTAAKPAHVLHEIKVVGP